MKQYILHISTLYVYKCARKISSNDSSPALGTSLEALCLLASWLRKWVAHKATFISCESFPGYSLAVYTLIRYAGKNIPQPQLYKTTLRTRRHDIALLRLNLR